ncbi:MAG: hypothetical protein JSS81_25695 [Acidobacteria bacterium]|nr:hypothetical protein [Acidobacteriota bacterium]
MKNFEILIKTSLLAICVFLIFSSQTNSQSLNEKCDVCLYWHSKVDYSIKLPVNYPKLDTKDEGNILEAINCLLKLEGKTNDSGFGTGGTSIEVSNAYPSPTVEVAALYYITYLYNPDWPHWAIKIVDKKKEKNDQEIVKAAYKAYRKWYEQIKKQGIKKARNANLTPFDGTDLCWYGPSC